MAIRIVLADDFAIVRREVRHILEARRDWTIVAEAADGQEALEKAKATEPDIAILDINMPKMNGLELTRQLRKLMPTLEVVIMTQHSFSAMVDESFRAGARGFVVKSAAGADLIAAVEAVSEHRTFVSAGVNK